MVSATPSAHELPQLSERESELLAAFLILRYDFVALAEQYKLLPQQLLAFAHSPAINAHLAAFKTFSETAFSLRHLEARVKALDILEKVATTEGNPVEQRRAASTIFRGIALGGLPLRGGSPSCPTKRCGLAIATSPLPEPSGASRRSIPKPPSRTSPSPRTTPSPHPSPENILQELASALADHHTDPDAHATIASFTAENATINNTPTPAAAFQSALDELIPPSEVVHTQVSSHSQHTPGPPETFSSSLYLIHDSTQQTRIEITFTRHPTGAHPNSWLISSLHIGPNTS